jgi:hypothetical protein
LAIVATGSTFVVSRAFALELHPKSKRSDKNNRTMAGGE